MKIICLIGSKNNHTLKIESTLQSMGHDIRIIFHDKFRDVCSYYHKKLDKLGFRSTRHNFIAQWNNNLSNLIDKFQPELLLAINPAENCITEATLSYAKQKCHTAVWLVDSFGQELRAFEHLLSIYHSVYAFDIDDIHYLTDNGHKSVSFLPVGYNMAYEVNYSLSPIYDITFVGTPYKNRLDLLEKLSQTAEQNEWKLLIIGPFYDEKYFWKKQIFKRKYPNIMKYLKNTSLPPDKVAKLYAQSKICLNIHLPKTTGLNPRTFEIMATGSLELMDERPCYNLIKPNKELITFADVDELIIRVQYYLQNKNERDLIAKRGQTRVLNNLSMINCLDKIITNMP